MSRLGRQPIAIPSKVEVQIKDRVVRAKGPLGELSEALPEAARVELKDGKLLVFIDNLEKNSAIYGTTRMRLANMIHGVAEGFSKSLHIVGVGYRGRLEGGKLIFQMGFSHPVEVEVPKDLKVVVGPKMTTFDISGASKEQVGSFAARVRGLRPPEPYKATGLQYVGEHIFRKAGKAAAGGEGKK
ncbi:MAG: 50S ribosomal protein L6 [Elusimicrobia bacterium]|nr:50S ribosomal protein L6 [Elusimicrobiota bacterium]